MSRYKLIINKVNRVSDVLYFEVPDDPGTYKLKFNPEGGGDPLDGGTVVVGNTENTYRISATLTNGTIINTGTFTTPKARYTITIENSSWGTIYNGSVKINSGDRVISGSVLIMTPTVTAGYTTTVSSSTGTINNNQLTVNGNETIAFNRKGITYYIKFNGNGATSGSMANQDFVYGTSEKLTANTFIRSHTVTYNYNGGTGSKSSETVTASFNGWSKTSSGSVEYKDEERVNKLTTVAGSTVNLYANWALSSVTLPVPTKTGYDFKGWSTSSTATSGVTGNYTVGSDLTLYAIWKLKEYSITFPKIPTGVSTYYILRKPSTAYTGAPTLQLLYASRTDERKHTVYYGDTLSIYASAIEDYTSPTYELRYDMDKGGGTSCVIGEEPFENGEVYIYIKAGEYVPKWRELHTSDYDPIILSNNISEYNLNGIKPNVPTRCAFYVDVKDSINVTSHWSNSGSEDTDGYYSGKNEDGTPGPDAYVYSHSYSLSMQNGFIKFQANASGQFYPACEWNDGQNPFYESYGLSSAEISISSISQYY